MNHFFDYHHPFEVLREAAGQKVVFCYECQLYHVHYGTIALDLSERGIQTLNITLGRYLAMYDGTIDPKRRCIEVETPCEGIRLLLSTHDLHAFKELLTDSVGEFEERIRLRRLN